MIDYPEDWVPGVRSYSRSRYDPMERNRYCLECGTELEGVDHRMGEYCPECEVVVWEVI